MNIVNGKPVENIKVIQKPNGEYEIQYTEKFNLITAHHGNIMKRLRKQGIECQIYKDLKHHYILILINEIEKAHLTLNILNVPHRTYKINKEDKIITIFLQPNNEKYRRII